MVKQILQGKSRQIILEAMAVVWNGAVDTNDEALIYSNFTAPSNLPEPFARTIKIFKESNPIASMLRMKEKASKQDYVDFLAPHYPDVATNMPLAWLQQLVRTLDVKEFHLIYANLLEETVE